jgi:hypothetical protein
MAYAIHEEKRQIPEIDGKRDQHLKAEQGTDGEDQDVIGRSL